MRVVKCNVPLSLLFIGEGRIICPLYTASQATLIRFYQTQKIVQPTVNTSDFLAVLAVSLIHSDDEK